MGMAEFGKLNSGALIPLVGLGNGTMEDRTSYEEKKAAIVTALQVGYRHFDTASLYGSEGYLGDALLHAIQAGTVKREELFVTTKLYCPDAYPDGVLPALQKSLSQLKLDYVDLYLIHFPTRLKEVRAPTESNHGNVLPFDMRGTWRAMEKCIAQGLVKSIGVSNFSSKKISDLLEFADIPPAVNQVEMHPKWQQKQLRDKCNKFNVHITAYSPLGAPGLSWGSPEILQEPIIKEIAAKHGKSPAQVALRWALDLGVSVVPKSYNHKRMVENLDVFGWHLSDDDHEYIAQIEQKKNMTGDFLLDPDGPCTTVTEYWDGEI